MESMRKRNYLATDDLPLSFLDAPTNPAHLGQLGTYQVIEVVGQGAMGIVLRAIDPALNRIVAIKVLHPNLATTATARSRFTREAQAAAAVSHDHVVTIHAVHEHKDLPYLVMQFVEGESLEERIQRSGPLGQQGQAQSGRWNDHHMLVRTLSNE
jgi:serine/threonine-protein kinase